MAFSFWFYQNMQFQIILQGLSYLVNIDVNLQKIDLPLIMVPVSELVSGHGLCIPSMRVGA